MTPRNLVLEEPGDPDVQLWTKEGSHLVWDLYGRGSPNHCEMGLLRK